MRIALFLGGQVPIPRREFAAFFDSFEQVRSSCAEVAQCTGYVVEDLLAGDETALTERAHSFRGLRQAALVMGMADVLADNDLAPVATGGISLGSLIAGSLAGAIGRNQLIEMLHYHRLIPKPSPTARAQGMAVALISSKDDIREFLPEGVYLAADYDVAMDGSTRVLVLSGYRDALDSLVDAYRSKMSILSEYVGAYHSPLVQPVADFMTPFVARMNFRQPDIPLASAQGDGVLVTAEQVSDAFTNGYLRPVGIRPLMDEFRKLETELIVGLGPGIPQSPKRVSAESLNILTVDNPSSLHALVEGRKNS